jgi:sugar phosphate isomerase/epimerase
VKICGGGLFRLSASFKEKLHISTIDERASKLAAEYGLGLEIADFCWAQRIDVELEENTQAALKKAKGLERLWFHAPFAELSPCAIDPKVRALTETRYREAISIAETLGVSRIVVHDGYIPNVYFPEYFVSESIAFWKEFLKAVPCGVKLALENVMDETPDMLREIVDGVSDKRLGCCLDIGHANCSLSKVPPLDWIKPLAPHLMHVHIHNNMGDRDLHSSLRDGIIPVREVLDRVMELAPDATFTIENMDSRDSLFWLCEQGYLK